MKLRTKLKTELVERQTGTKVTKLEPGPENVQFQNYQFENNAFGTTTRRLSEALSVFYGGEKRGELKRPRYEPLSPPDAGIERLSTPATVKGWRKGMR
jgi:hypothetical protein